MGVSRSKEISNGNAINTSTVTVSQPTTSTMSNHSHIPVPKPTHKSTFNFLTKRSNSGNSMITENKPPPSPTLRARGTSVAAQRASFELLDAAASSTGVQKPIFNNNIFNDSNLQDGNSDNGSQSSFKKIMYACSNSKLNGTNNNHSTKDTESKWRLKYEDSEKKRKSLLQNAEIVNKKHTDLEKQHNKLVDENNTLLYRMQNKDHELQKLRTVSEAVCKEYEQLKHQYDVEIGAMHKAMQQASQWYKQNRQLKRQSQVLVQKIIESSPTDPTASLWLNDEVDCNDGGDDAEELRNTIKELSAEIAKLQTELNAARLQEFEAQEQVAQLNAKLDDEKEIKEKNEETIRQLTIQKDNMHRISQLVADEVVTLRSQYDKEKEDSRLLRMQTEEMQKERNILVHQSALLLADVGDDPNRRFLTALEEIETLKRHLEEEKQEHAILIQDLQDKIEEKESNVEFEIVEEKLKLAEVELNMMQERAERSEKEAQKFKEISKKLELRIDELEKTINNNLSSTVLPSTFTPPPAPLPPPMPPPPPPPPPPSGVPFNTNLKFRTKGHSQDCENGNSTAISDMENILGISKKSAAAPQQPAIDDIINQIKGGKFTLKHTNKQRTEEEKKKKEIEASAAVSEMLNILGTMRRRTSKSIRQSSCPESTQINSDA